MGGIFFGGSSKFFGGVPPNFWGGIFWGVPPNFGGVFFSGVPPNFRGVGGSPPEYGQRSAGMHPTGMHSC